MHNGGTFNTGDTVRVKCDTNGMPAGSEGAVIGWYTNTEQVLVRFWDGGPIRVPFDALELARAAGQRPA